MSRERIAAESASMIEAGYPTYVVDDEPDVRAAIAFQLDTAGRSVATFASGAEFLAAMNNLPPGCLLIDVRMPGQDGIALLENLRDRGSNWPVIMMTGHGEIATAVQAIQGGAIDFIEKPFAETLLLACLANGAKLLARQAVIGDPA